MKSFTMRRFFAVTMAILTVFGVAITAYASGGPSSGGNGSITVDGISLPYTWDSTYYTTTSGNAAESGAAASVSLSGATLTLSATSSKYTNLVVAKYYAQNVSTECTITNNSGSTLEIGYTKDTAVSVSVTNGTVSASGIVLEYGGTITLQVVTSTTSTETSSKTSSGTFTIISCSAVSSYDLTLYSSSFGSYSYTLGETNSTVEQNADAHTESASNGDTITCTVPEPGEGVTDYTFYGWSVNGTVIASKGNYTGSITTHTTILPVFIKSGTADNDGPFSVNGTRYVTLPQAFKAAGSTYPVIVAEDYILPTTLEENGYAEADDIYISGTDGDLTYIIPVGAKLLVPCNSSDDGSFTSAPTDTFLSLEEGVTRFDSGGITARNSTYCTLTVPSGAKLDCYGAINVNGQRQKDGQPYSGVALGGHGKIILGQETSTFTERAEEDISQQLIVRDGGTLYCYGYITGTGMVEVYSGGKVHEYLQLCSWPGGGNAFKWYAAKHTSFLLTQYYLQNIEAPYKVNYGGISYLEVVTTQSEEQNTASTPFINTESNGTGMFLLNTGAYVLRIYDQSQDRMNYYLKGGVIDFGYISVSFKYGITTTISSKDYILPLCSNISVFVESGATLNVAKKLSVLPGAQIVTKSGSTVNLTNQVYIWDVNDWKEAYLFSRAYDDDSYYNSGYTMTNKSPNVNPLPYVATLNDISPRTRALVRLKDGTGETYFMDAINYTESGHVEINGTLNISGSGSLCTSNGTGTDKYVKGEGIISITATPAAGSLTAGYDSTVNTIETVAGLANLAGLGELQSFSVGTYYGLGEEHGNYWYQYKVETNATCTEDAYTTYTCDNATSSYIVTEDGTAKGHTDENSDDQCDVCGRYYVLKIVAANVAVGDSLDLYFYVEKAAVDHFDSEGTGVFEAVLVRTYADGNNETKIVAFSDWENYSDTLYRFCYSDIAAKEMTDKVTATIYYTGTTTQACESRSESVESYALRELRRIDTSESVENSDEKLRTALVDMLNYGAECQKYFKYGTGTLANAKLSGTDEEGNKYDYTSYATSSDSSYENNTSYTITDDYTLEGISVTVKSQLYMTFYLSGITDPSGYTATATYTDHYKTEKNVEIPGSKFVTYTENGTTYYGVPITGVSMVDGRQVITCVITDSGKTKIAEIKSSVESYVYAVDQHGDENLKAVCVELMKFVDSAYEYFHPNTSDS